MNIKANAKINLSLEIVGTDDRGYHLLRTVMQSLMLCDDIDISVSEDNKLHLEVQDERGLGAGLIPCDSSNLMYRAAELMIKRYHIDGGVRMRLVKRIPSEAGLGGGSADAAAVLKGINELFALGLSNEELEHVGLMLGADVPYCAHGGTMLAEGIGEILTKIDSKCRLYVLIIKPMQGMSTPKVYAAYDRMQEAACTGESGSRDIIGTSETASITTYIDAVSVDIGAAETGSITTHMDASSIAIGAAETEQHLRPANTRQVHLDTDELINALECGDCTLVYKKIKNVLEPPATKALPLIGRVKSDLLSFGAKAAAMTGSGSAVYGLFSDRGALQLAHKGFEACDYLGDIQDIIETEFA